MVIIFTGDLGRVRLMVPPQDTPKELGECIKLAKMTAEDLGPTYNWTAVFDDDGNKILWESEFKSGAVFINP